MTGRSVLIVRLRLFLAAGGTLLPAAHRVGAQLQHAGEDCWASCGQQQGPCSWCGSGMCCNYGYADHSNGCDGTIGTPGSNRHECSEAPTHAPAFPEFVLHAGEDCWASCGQQGPCSWCGSGMCCKYGYDDHSNGCDGTIGQPGSDRHECSEAPNLGLVCDSPLNEHATYVSEESMSAAGWSFDFDEEADHGYHAVYVRGAGPIDEALNSRDYCVAPDPAGHGSLMSGWKWSDNEGELAAILHCANCDAGVVTIEFSNCNTGHVQVRLNNIEVARCESHEIKTVSVPFRNGDRVGVHDAGGNAVVGLYGVHLVCDTAGNVDGAARADERCDMGTIQQQLAAVNDICCDGGACETGALAPSFCSCECAQEFPPFFHRCEATLDAMARLTGGDSRAYEDFESLCTQSPQGNQCCGSLQTQFDILEDQLRSSQATVRALRNQLLAAGMRPVKSHPGSCNDASWTTVVSEDPLRDSYCYKYFARDHVEWTTAQDSCIALGATLAQISTPEINHAVRATLPQDAKPFIDGTDVELESTWLSTDGSVLPFLNFAEGEPNLGTAENCLSMYFPNGRWADVPCDGRYVTGYVCMIELVGGNAAGGH